MASDKMTGKKMEVSWAGEVLKLTKATPKGQVKYDSCTDTGNYDPATDLVYEEQLPSTASVEIGIEGNYDRTKTSGQFIAKLFNGSGGPYDAYFAPETGLNHYTGKYDLTDFTITSQYDTVTTFSATLKSNKKFAAT